MWQYQTWLNLLIFARSSIPRSPHSWQRHLSTLAQHSALSPTNRWLRFEPCLERLPRHHCLTQLSELIITYLAAMVSPFEFIDQRTSWVVGPACTGCMVAVLSLATTRWTTHVSIVGATSTALSESRLIIGWPQSIRTQPHSKIATPVWLG